MDPTACFQRWFDLKSALDDPRNEDRDEIDDAKNAANNLLNWLVNDGFAPDQWTDPEQGNDLRREFCDWCVNEWPVDSELIRELLINAPAKDE